MKLVNGLKALALTAFIFSSQACTTDGVEESVETVEEENQLPAQTDEAVDVELPSAEAASVEAEQGVETIDQNSDAGVQALATEQQIAVDEAAQAGVANGAGQELVPAPIPGAETDAMSGMPAQSPDMPESTIPEAPVAQAEAPATSPELPAETTPTIPTFVDDTNDSATVQGDAAPSQDEVKVKKSKKAKKSKGKRVVKTPVLSGNEKLYIVQPGDTLAKISTALYGTSGEWKNLADINGINGSKIFPGDALKYVPNEKTAAFEAKYDGLPKSNVTVEKGDTLAKIAARVMGDVSYWKMLWRWNEASIPDANKIAVGMSLSFVATKDLENVSSATAH